ncbi:hypothetical protein SMB554_11230 [Sinorhizobium meliloti]|nr:hypothetical protein SMB554_11230 [Sinorhizobium meliloti]
MKAVEIHLEFMTAAARWIMALKLWSVLSARTPGDCNLSSSVISVLVTEIQQRRDCGAGNVSSAQGLGLAGSL